MAAAPPIRPMLATLAPAPLDDPNLVYEPKYDGIRAVIEVEPRGGPVRIWSRLGNEKSAQFPEIVGAIRQWSRSLTKPVVLDGEIVALDAKGEPAGFQNLQGRIHLSTPDESLAASGVPVAFIAFDLLREGTTDLTSSRLLDRRARLEQLLKGGRRPPLLRLSTFARGDGRHLYDEALARGWEGVIAKHAESPYRVGKRTPEWRKVKIVRRQEFVVGGWTDPRASRAYFGALLLGVYDKGGLVYVGHSGSGFDDRELKRVWSKLKPLETSRCPFAVVPKTNERPHWVEPRLVVEVKFTEWTTDGKLRHPIYLGLRDDVRPEDVRREPSVTVEGETRGKADEHGNDDPPGNGPAPSSLRPVTARKSRPSRSPRSAVKRPSDHGQIRKPKALDTAALNALIGQIDDLQARGVDGALQLPSGESVKVTNLRKVFWPKLKLTKGDLLRYYVRVAPFLLPAVNDRPLVMKRLPNGVDGQAFYQQRAPDHLPPGVRVETLPSDEEVPSRIVGGSLLTLLYMTQIAAISQDPWFSRVQSSEFADHVALDLDPAAGVKFSTVLDVARWIHDELRRLKVEAYPKTSGSNGLHIYIPLPRETPYEAGLIFCQIVATLVARKHPKEATVERAVRARGQRVYVDYLQNIRGKTLATAYSARASAYAGASAPLTWKEVHEGVDRESFTIKTLPDRLQKVGDLWKGLRESKGIDLRVAEKLVR
jgi:bifunctional non-homologous end joining protein LigD